MNLEQVIQKMESNIWALRKSKKQLSKYWHCSEEDIVAAKRAVQKKLNCSCRGKYYKTDRPTQKPLPKVLIFDIETAPMKAYVWKRWKENISLDQTISEWFVICWSAKWLYSEEVMSDTLTSEEAILENDERIVKSLWKLFDEADVVVGHNISGFDVPKMNSRFVVYGLNPPSHYFKVDTFDVAKRNFGFSSNKLDALATSFGIPNKIETNFQLWKDCLDGDEDALYYMTEYNKKDVEIAEAVYLKLRPYIKSHPNISLLTDRNCCCNCGSEDLELVENKYYCTSVSKFPIYRCKHCGTLVRGRKNVAERPRVVPLAK